MNLLGYLGKKPKPFVLTFAIALVAFVGFVDYLTGIELSLSIFYLLPISIVAWYAGKWEAYLISILSAFTWLLVDMLAARVYAYPFIHYWNAAVRLGIFLIVTYILSKLKSSIEYELESASEIQKGFLPKEVPQIQGYEISCVLKPSHAVSGDYFDVIKYNENELGLCVADVVGHGIPAALLMSNLQAAVKIFASSKIVPQELCEKLNRTISKNIVSGRFITFFYGLLDAKRKKLVYTNAGHNPPILLRKDGSHILLDANDLVLGISHEWKYNQGEIDLHSGDRLILFTDGVTELSNFKEKQFGVERLINLLEKNHELDASDLQKLILAELTKFSKGVFPDDITLVVIAAQ
ncbi:MAG: PP2C family protein-serine/threonine phosphatase [bacterium]